MKRRVLIYGGRDYTDSQSVLWALKAIDEKDGVEVVIEGEAAGADTCGRWAAKRLRIPVLPFKANWAKFGRRAGPIRNQQMLDEGRPTLGLACPGGAGTADMTRRLQLAGVEIRYV